MSEEMLFLSEELALAYPNAKKAILLCQLFNEQDWEMVCKVCEVKGFDFILKHMKAACLKGGYRDIYFMTEAEKEFETKDFANFLKAKLGML